MRELCCAPIPKGSGPFPGEPLPQNRSSWIFLEKPNPNSQLAQEGQGMFPWNSGNCAVPEGCAKGDRAEIHRDPEG